MWHSGSGTCTAASQQEGHGFDSRMGRCWLWVAGPPQTFSAQAGCSPCVHKGFPPIRTPTEKNMQKQNILLSVRDRDGRFTCSPGAEKLPTAPGGVLEEGRSGMGEMQSVHFTATSGLRLCVCVCPVSPP